VSDRRQFASLAWTLGTAAVVIAADQVTKSLAVNHFYRPRHVFGPFGLGLAYNSGAAFSLFTGDAGVVIVVAIVFAGVLGFAAWRSTSRLLSVALGLVLGGALGNLADRLFRGHHRSVVDFVTLEHWPTFNVADACITVGVILIIAATLFGRARVGRGS
jgi:signal peptidase II